MKLKLLIKSVPVETICYKSNLYAVNQVDKYFVITLNWAF